jgi:hypothetical protein
MSMPDRGQGLTPTENVGRGFIPRSTLPAQWAVCQPHQVKLPALGIMPGKESGNHLGLFFTQDREKWRDFMSTVVNLRAELRKC